LYLPGTPRQGRRVIPSIGWYFFSSLYIDRIGGRLPKVYDRMAGDIDDTLLSIEGISANQVGGRIVAFRLYLVRRRDRYVALDSFCAVALESAHAVLMR
jgi:hypothetical protein